MPIKPVGRIAKVGRYGSSRGAVRLLLKKTSTFWFLFLKIALSSACILSQRSSVQFQLFANWKNQTTLNLFRRITMARSHSNICGGETRVIVAGPLASPTAPAGQPAGEVVGLQMKSTGPNLLLLHLLLINQLTGSPVKGSGVGFRS